MEEESDDFSNYYTSYAVRPQRPGENNSSLACPSPTTFRLRHLHVRFNFCAIDDGEQETRTVCLTNDLFLFLGEDELCNFVLREGLLYWPIQAETMVDIAENVVEKIGRLRCNLEVDIYSVLLENGEESNEVPAPGVVGGGGAYDCRASKMKSLRRKRVEYESAGEQGDGCAICLEEITAVTEVAVLPCDHYSFHDGCLSTWLDRSLSCPLCRRKIPRAAASSCS